MQKEKQIKKKKHSRLIDISHHLESLFNTILLNLSTLNSSVILLSEKSQNIEGIIASNRNKFTILRPVDLYALVEAGNSKHDTNLFCLNLDPPDQATSGPIIEANSTLSFNAK